MPRKAATPKLQRYAAELRHNQTEEETRLWSRLRAHRFCGVHFRRQHAIGSYIVDFCSIRKKLVIELDGSHHLEQQGYDNERTAFLELKGYRILRFWNSEVMNDMEGVIRVIEHALEIVDFPPDSEAEYE